MCVSRASRISIRRRHACCALGIQKTTGSDGFFSVVDGSRQTENKSRLWGLLGTLKKFVNTKNHVFFNEIILMAKARD
jgi:hypothetical protein